MLSKTLWLIGATAGGAIGWWLGAKIGLMTAVVLGAAGTALGVYYARRFVMENL